MKYTIKKVIVLIMLASIFLIFPGCGTKVKVQRVKDKKMEKDGVFYALPQSVVTVAIPINKVISTPGPLSNCAGLLLGIKVQKEKKTEFKLGDPVIETR